MRAAAENVRRHASRRAKHHVGLRIKNVSYRRGSMIHQYKLLGANIILDIESGSIHVVDDAAYDAIGMYESAGPVETAAQVGKTYPEISGSDISELVSDVGKLKEQGKLFAPESLPANMGTSRERPVKALCLNVSHLCNMTCVYCFAGKGEYGGGRLMPIETGKRAVDFLVENSGERKNLDIDFFGGEPLLNWDVIKGIVDYARLKERKSGKLFRFTLTTNGLLIDDEIIDFTRKEMRSVVLSLDGRPSVNDAMRKLPCGAGSYNAVLPKIKKLVESRREAEYYIRGTYTRENLDFVRDILHLADLGFSELSMEPVVTRQHDPDSIAIGITMDEFPAICAQYENLAQEMVRRKREGKGFNFYHYTLDLTGGPCVHKRAAGCGVGTEYLAVTPSGELYPCHQFVGDRKFLMGDVFGGITNKGLRDQFGSQSICSRLECQKCWARYYCGGGCAANAFYESGSVGGIYELGCEMFKKRIECAVFLAVSQL